jgi:hypothetical protein
MGSSFLAPGGLGVIGSGISSQLRWRIAGRLRARLTNGIKPSLVERMASQQPPESQPYTACRSIFAYGLQHVLRTGWIKPASGWQHRRKPALVEPQQRHHDSLHLLTNFRTSLRNSSNGASTTVLRGFRTTSHRPPTAASSARQASRIRRLMRFRRTAFPTARGTVKPTRAPVGRPGSAVSRQNAVNKRVLNRIP